MHVGRQWSRKDASIVALHKEVQLIPSAWLHIMIRGCAPSEKVQQPHPIIIFRGTCTKISAEERAAYYMNVDVFWQRCAWADAAFMNAWAVVMKKHPAFFNTKPKLLFLDSLTAHKDEAFLKTLKDQMGVHFLPRGITDMLQAMDTGVGQTFEVVHCTKVRCMVAGTCQFSCSCGRQGQGNRQEGVDYAVCWRVVGHAL